MLRVQTEAERALARRTLEEVTRKLEEALRLSRELEQRARTGSVEWKGIPKRG